MKNKRRLSWSLVITMICMVLVCSAVLLTAFGDNITSSDPLISLSFLNNVFKKDVMDEVKVTVNTEITAMESELNQKINFILSNSGSTGSAVTPYMTSMIPVGSSSNVAQGMDFLIVSGEAVAKRTGIFDLTDGAAVAVGDPLVENHLYIAVSATAFEAKTVVEALIRY